MSTKSQNDTEKTVMSTSTHHKHTKRLLQLSYIPVLVCVLAFGKSAYHRIATLPPQCQAYGWYSSSSAEFQCDHKPLDIHATLALLWLAVYSAQVLLLASGFSKFHALLGRLVGLPIAMGNAAGMFYLAFTEAFGSNRMEKTDRPSDFTPFMFLVATKVSICLVLSLWGLYKSSDGKRDLESHKIWMFRAFISSFTTPVIRFYPMVLRLIAGKQCFDENRDKFVMGAMFVSEVVSVIVYTLAQMGTQPVFWDTFMKLQALTFAFALGNEVNFASTHGLFIQGMLECAVSEN